VATRPYHRSDRNLIEKLIEAAERYARIREINADRFVRDGMLGLTDIRKEERAREAYISARAELRKRFPSAAERRVDVVHGAEAKTGSWTSAPCLPPIVRRRRRLHQPA